MSIKEKAKAYDEAFEKAKKKYNSKYHPSEGPSGVYLNNADLEDIFPELKESEDERITRAINNMLPFIPDEAYANNGVTKEGVLNWLEKQKEQKSSIIEKLREISTPADEDWFEIEKKWKKEDEQKPTVSREEILHQLFQNGSITLSDYLYLTKKQKEQDGEDEEYTDFTIYHPLKNGKGEYECIPYSFYGSLTSFSEHKDLIDFLRACFYTKEECNKWIDKQKEQKPVARESDFVSKPRTSVEILRHYLVWAENSEEDCPYTWKTLADAISDGIKALEEQQPAEWSDTNELVFKDICKHLKEEGYNGWIVLLEALRNGEFQPKQK